MFATPEIRKSDLNAVRRFLTSVRDEERLERIQRDCPASATPLGTRVAARAMRRSGAVTSFY
jgi:hypothetical protein